MIKEKLKKEGKVKKNEEKERKGKNEIIKL
jgi:hypothetical protein